jgi:phosphate acetyltransferase
VAERDYVLEMLLAHDGVELSYEQTIGVTYDDVHNDPDAALSVIVERYKAVERECDAVVILGSDYTDVATPTELAYNARIAANLGAPVLLVLTGREPDESRPRTANELRQVTELSLPELATAHASLFAVIANRVDPDMAFAAANTETLRQRIVAPLLGVLDHSPDGDAERAATALDVRLL